jgi:hypothetical protein
MVIFPNDKINKEKKMLNYVSISGYGWTGSSACIDLLREFEGFGAIQGEFRIAKDPYGLIDLEESLVNNWDFVRQDVAIRDFLNFCKVLSRNTGLFSRVGKDFSNKLNVDFMLESELYIDKLVDMRYLGNTSVHRYYISAYKNFFMKMRNKYGGNNAVPMYLARPSKSDFIRETRSYINNLFANYTALQKVDTLVLDQAVSPGNIVNTSNYFENIKIIIIDRDPRDIYSSLVKNNTLLGPDLNRKDSIEKYTKWHKILRSNFQYKEASEERFNNLLKINFEDLVCNYDDSVEKIKNFLGGSIDHKYKYKYFDPNSKRSKSNVGLWKNYKNQSIMSKISEELGDYCYFD